MLQLALVPLGGQPMYMYLKAMKVMMVRARATRDTLTPTIPMTCSDSVTPSLVCEGLKTGDEVGFRSSTAIPTFRYCHTPIPVLPYLYSGTAIPLFQG